MEREDTGKQRNWQPKREPDVETMGFRLWEVKKGENYGEGLLEINYDKGEEVHESRVYHSPSSPVTPYYF